MLDVRVCVSGETADEAIANAVACFKNYKEVSTGACESPLGNGAWFVEVRYKM